MGLSDFLSSALTVGTQAAGAHQSGLAERKRTETADLLEQIKLARQKQQDDMARQLQEATLAQTEARTRQLTEPKPDEPYKPPMTVSPGQGVRQPDGTYKVMIPARPRLRAGAGSGNAGLGSPDETRHKSRIAGWTAATIKAGEKDPERLVAAAVAMNPGVDPQIVAAAVYDTITKLEPKPPKGSEGGEATPTAPVRPAGWSDAKWNKYLKDTEPM